MWHTKTIENIFDQLTTRNEGLTDKEVLEKLHKFGPNALPEGKTDSLFVIFLRQFQSPLIYILIVAALVVYFMGETIDAGVVLFVLVFNAVTGAIQEGRAQSTLAALKKLTGTNATVLRNNQELIVSDSDIVPGDIILLREGEKVPADARIISSHNLQINESGLTGESLPIYKNEGILANKDLIIADQLNMIFKSTYIIGGSGKAVVVATGINTQIGKIAKEISLIDVDIPLKKNIADLSRLIVMVVFVISLVLLVLGVVAQKPIKEILTTVISLVISIIPEGLPIVITLILAKGVWDMSKRNVLVKRLQAVEALGQTKVIAVDKTGTLTKNEMVVKQIYTDGSVFQVEGFGYESVGNIIQANVVIKPENNQNLALMGKHAALVSEANIFFDTEKQSKQITGDPTEAALLVFAQKLGYSKEKLENTHTKIKELPFDYKAKYRAVISKFQNNETLTVIGAPEKILSLCSFYQNKEDQIILSAKKRENLETVFQTLAKEGLRVVGIAVKNDVKISEGWSEKNDLAFIGFFGIQDALREEIAPAVSLVNKAGIKVVMITGDHKLTAESIARQAGIYNQGDIIITGEEINNLNEKQFEDLLPKISVFVRVTPEHKLNIVKAYKKIGLIVAMTGDGVNDAPSLVAADLGIAMGKIGTEVAKEASDIVLLDDNFNSIVSAIEEGRNIYKTIKKALLFLFSTAFGEVLIISSALVIGVFSGMPLPLLPAQILWVNLVGDGILGIFLAYEPKEPGLLNGKFGKTSKYIVDMQTIKRLIPMSIIMASGTLMIFMLNYKLDYAKALTMSFTALAVYQWFNAWNCKSDSSSLFNKRSFKNIHMNVVTALVVLLHIFAIYSPFMQKVFRTVPLNLTDWLIILLFGSSILITDEIGKFFQRHKERKLNNTN